LEDVAVLDLLAAVSNAVTFVWNDGSGIAQQRSAARRMEQDNHRNTLKTITEPDLDQYSFGRAKRLK
jgi:hypothetical protein